VGPSIITTVLKSARGREKRAKEIIVCKGLGLSLLILKMEEGSQGMWVAHLNLEGAQKWILFLEPPGKKKTCPQLDLSLVRAISDF
jgi:hypothetical protein